MILVLLAYYIAWGVHGEKIRKSTVQSLREQPTQFSATPLMQRPRQLRWRISGVQQQGLAAFQQCRNLAESCFKKKTESGVRKHRTVTLIAPSASGDWRSSSIFQSPDTVDSAFLWPFRITEYLRRLVSVCTSVRLSPVFEYGWFTLPSY